MMTEPSLKATDLRCFVALGSTCQMSVSTPSTEVKGSCAGKWQVVMRLGGRVMEEMWAVEKRAEVTYSLRHSGMSLRTSTRKAE